MNMGEAGKLNDLKKKLQEAHSKGPVNFQSFVETLRRSFGSGGTGSQGGSSGERT
jgi:hypothetical protein